MITAFWHNLNLTLSHFFLSLLGSYIFKVEKSCNLNHCCLLCPVHIYVLPFVLCGFFFSSFCVYCTYLICLHADLSPLFSEAAARQLCFEGTMNKSEVMWHEVFCSKTNKDVKTQYKIKSHLEMDAWMSYDCVHALFLPTLNAKLDWHCSVVWIQGKWGLGEIRWFNLSY